MQLRVWGALLRASPAAVLSERSAVTVERTPLASGGVDSGGGGGGGGGRIDVRVIPPALCAQARLLVSGAALRDAASRALAGMEHARTLAEADPGELAAAEAVMREGEAALALASRDAKVSTDDDPTEEGSWAVVNVGTIEPWLRASPSVKWARWIGGTHEVQRVVAYRPWPEVWRTVERRLTERCVTAAPAAAPAAAPQLRRRPKSDWLSSKWAQRLKVVGALFLSS